MRRFTVLALAATACASAGNWKAHPEWGPPPPVAPFGLVPLPEIHHVVGMYFPLIGNASYTNDYNVNRGRYRHTGIDIRAPKMTPIVAPFGGNIGMKHETFWIYGDDGWTVLGTHLNDDDPGTHDRKGRRDVEFAPDLVPGQHVEAGQFIGYVGMSGNATGPHLHFELYAPGSGPTMKRIRNPLASLKGAIRLRHPIFKLPEPDDRPNPGHVRIDACVRGIDERSKGLYLILVAVEHAREPAHLVTQLRYLRLTVPDDVVNEAGGWQALAQVPPTRRITVFVDDQPNLKNEPVARMRLNEPDALVAPPEPVVNQLLRRFRTI